MRMGKRELVELEGIKVTAYLLGLTWIEPQLKIEYEGKEIDLTKSIGEYELDLGTFMIVKEMFTEEQLLVVDYVINNIMDEDKVNHLNYGLTKYELKGEYKEKLEKLDDEAYQKWLETIDDSLFNRKRGY